MNLFPLLLARPAGALTAPFGLAQLGTVVALAGLYGLLAIPLGLASGLLRPPWRGLTTRTWLQLAGSLLLMPALMEEGIFRVLLLPRPLSDLELKAQLAWAGLSVGLFVLYHPVAGRLWYPPGRPLFEQARFLLPCSLLPCSLLGAICVIAYGWSGSLWAPVLIHWLTVLIWLGPGDGARDLTDRRSARRTAH